MAKLVWLLAVVVTVALHVEPSGAAYVIQAGNVSASSSLGHRGVIAGEGGPPYRNEIEREEELLQHGSRRERQGISAVPLPSPTEYGRRKKTGIKARARTRASSSKAPNATTDTLNTSSPSIRHHSPSSCPLPPGVREEIRRYQKTVDQIVEYVVHGPHKGRAYDTLAHLVDDFGPRLVSIWVATSVAVCKLRL